MREGDTRTESEVSIEIRLTRLQQLFHRGFGRRVPALQQSLHNYFDYRLSECRRRLRFFFRDGRIALGIGLAFLFVCIVLRQLALAWGQGVVPEIAEEGLLIVGWVAMWRPLEIFLYDWRPMRCRLYAKLARVPVTVRQT